MSLNSKQDTILHVDIVISTQETDAFIITLGRIIEVATHLYILTGTIS